MLLKQLLKRSHLIGVPCALRTLSTYVSAKMLLIGLLTHRWIRSSLVANYSLVKVVRTLVRCKFRSLGVSTEVLVYTTFGGCPND